MALKVVPAATLKANRSGHLRDAHPTDARGQWNPMGAAPSAIDLRHRGRNGMLRQVARQVSPAGRLVRRPVRLG
jgi:hypothetical protein